MQRAAIFTLLILAGAAFAAVPLTTEISTPPAPAAPAAVQSGQVFEHIDAMYDRQGNLIGADIDGVGMDSLYWKDYYSMTYLKSSDKITSPSPTNRTAMSFQNQQSGACMTPDGEYVYEVSGTNLRRFSTTDGSQTNYTLSYSGYAICGTDGNYIYQPNGTSIYKYTMTGTYVNTTTVNYSSGTYAFGVANDTVWVGSGYTYYGYGCNRFTGGSISNDVTWATGMSGATMMNVNFDGTYYYISCGGYSSNTFMRFYENRTTYTTGTVYIDTRSVMCKAPPTGLSQDSLYWKPYAINNMYGSAKAQSPTAAARTAMAFLNADSRVCMDPAGDSVYETYGTTLRRFKTSDGTYLDRSLSYTGGSGCATDGQYIYRPRSSISTTIDKYTMTGTYVNSTTTNYACDAYSMSCARDTVWFTNDRYTSGGVNIYGYACSKFTGSSISNDVTWNVGTGTNGIGGLAYDGTYWYLPWIGQTSITFKRFYSNRTLYTTGTVNIDSRSVMCRVPPRHDVGVTRIIAPTGTVDSGTVVTPACSVYNYGNVTEASYKVRLTIGSYVDSATVTAHAPRTYAYAAFANWTARPRGSLAVSCSTRVTGDADSSNNKATGSVMVDVRDASVSHLLAPIGAYDSSMVVTPSCSVSNYGAAAISCSVRVKIGSVYNQAVFVTAQAAGTRAHYVFPTWTVGTRGSYAVSCSTELTADMKTANDKVTRTVTVNVPNVGVSVLIAPTGTIVPGTVVTPACSVFNYGSTTPASYVVRMRIGTVYSQTATVASHSPGNRRYVTFPTWTAVVGTFAVSCSTELTGDVGPDNDKKSGQVTVPGGGGGGGWTAKNPMPAGAKAIKDGGWLAYDASKARIYATRGQKQPDFWAYAPVGDSWGLRAPWQPGTEGKLPQKGSVGCADGNGIIYATKGNNTTGFHKYDANANTWTQKKDVPLGLSNKKVKGGTDLAWAYKGGVGYAYLLKGYKNEFYRYNAASDSWTTLTPAPIGASQKWDKGSWLAYDDVNNKIYAFKAKYMELYRYSPESDSWSAALAPMPIVGSAGSKKAKDGSCGVWDDTDIAHIWALKGGNTREFWQYTVATNAWAEKETIPTGTLKKKVKAGADIVAVGTVLYATKGNKDNALWMYTPGAFVFDAPRQDGVLAGKTVIAQGMSISPNPLAGGFAVLRYGLPKAGAAELSVYNVAGQTVMARTLVAGRSGSVDLDLRHLSNGVYLVKFASEGFVNSQKLVVQR
jgi:hypothetical protein